MPTVTHLFRKITKGEPVVPAPDHKLNLIEKFGIEGDRNANIRNPRQILISSIETLKKFNINPGDLKENIVIKGLDVDRLQSGATIQIGRSAQVRITFNCEPCSYVESIRKGLAKEIHGNRGILGVIIKSGEINIGDKVKVLDKKFSQIPYPVFDRFAWLIKQIPEGKIITYKQIIESLGLFSIYFRVLPGYIRKAEKLGIPVYRIVDSSGKLLEFLENQQNILHDEHIKIIENQIDTKKYSWDTSKVYY